MMTHARHPRTWLAVSVLLIAAGSVTAEAAVVVTTDPTTFSNLFRPDPSNPDDPGLAGFTYLMSSRTGSEAEDQIINVGGDTVIGTTAIGVDLGVALPPGLSGRTWNFSIEHRKGQGFVFTLNDSSVTSVVAWGDAFAPPLPSGSLTASSLDGQAPLSDFNGLQLQIRAQRPGASMTVDDLALSGLEVAAGGDPLFNGTVTLATPGTLPDDDGRIVQWLLGNDLATHDWTLSGTLIGVRADIGGINSVRFVVDLVRDTSIPPPIPEVGEPTTLAMLAFGLTLLGASARRRSSTPSRS